MSIEPTEDQNRPEKITGLEERAALLDALRAFGVALSPSVVLELFVASSIVAVISGWLFRPWKGLNRLLQPLMALGAMLPWIYLLTVRPWHVQGAPPAKRSANRYLVTSLCLSRK